MDREATDSSVQRFWDRYLQFIHDQGIGPPADRWHVIRAEQYIRAFPDKRVTEHTPDDVTAYLTRQGRDTALKDWQFRQMVGAIQNLFAVIGASWAGKFDWEYWRAAAQVLGENHPTIAREAGSETRETAARKAPTLGSVRRRKDRYVPLPNTLVDDLRRQIAKVEALHAQDLAAGYGEVLLPDALARKYARAGREFKWQFLFPFPKQFVRVMQQSRTDHASLAVPA